MAGPGMQSAKESHPVRWRVGWGALAGFTSAFLIACLGMRLYYVAGIPKPTIYPAHDLPAGYVAFWCAVVAIPAIAALLLGAVRRLRAFTVGWLLTFVLLCAVIVMNIVSLDTHLWDH